MMTFRLLLFFYVGSEMKGACNGDGTLSVLLKRVDRLQHGAIWKCGIPLEYSNQVVINVSVPVTSVDIYPPVETYMKENHTQLVICKPSACRPRPTVSWYLTNSIKYDITEHSKQINILNNDGLIKAESSLHVLLNRSLNGWMLYCEAWSYTVNSAISSKKVDLNVSYPPDSPPVIHGYETGKTYRVIESDDVELSCSVTGGNPLASLSWNCFNSRFITITNISTVTSNMTWKAVRYLTFCSCESYHIVSGKTSTNVTVDVLYPPNIPAIIVSNGKDYINLTSGRINITETETISLTCYTESRPIPRYNWFVNKSKYILQENVLHLENISRRDAGNYTCYVSNLMNSTFGNAKVGDNSSTMQLYVLYPSYVASLKDVSIYEGSTLNISCPAIHGTPTRTHVYWTRTNDHRLWNSSQLIIPNVLRTDAAVYTCTVFNEMIPTIGQVSKTEKSGIFHLNIFFAAEIKSFSVLGKESEEVIIVNETENVTFACVTEANPVSDITIRNVLKEQIVKESETHFLQHTLHNISYVNAGKYVCNVWNSYTNGQTSSSLILIVRCPPRPSSDDTDNRELEIAASKYDSVTLLFTARNYLDEPDKTIFKWFKENSLIENNNTKFVTSSDSLQSNLTISNITQTDFGLYKVHVFNSVGLYIQTYRVTKATPVRPLETGDFSYTGTFVSVGISTVVAITVIVVTVVLGYRHFKRKQKNQNSDRRRTGHENQTALTYEGLDVSKEETDMYSQLPSTYEQLSSETKEKSIYMEMAVTAMELDCPDYINIRI